jgi:cobalamin biosynthesis Mg chelatase CobN
MMPARDPAHTPPNEAVVDPTRNVRDLVAAENRRQDDLREIGSEHVRELAEVRSDCQRDEIAGLQHIERLRASHAKELRIAEAARIDAINAQAAQAVQQAAAVQDTKATALAAQVAASAEAMREQVAAAATAAATALATALAPITASIEQLRQAMYEAAGGKKEVVETHAKSANTGLWWVIGLTALGLFFAGLMVIFAAITLAALLTHGFTK